MVTFAVLWFGYLNMLLLKVGISGVAISEPWVTSTFNISLGQTAPSAWKYPKTQFLRPSNGQKTWILSKGPHTLWPIINKHTETGQKLSWIYQGIDWTLYMLQVKTLSHWKARIWLLVVSKKIPDTPTKTHWSQDQFQEGRPTHCKTIHAFPTHLWVTELWPQIHPLWQAQDSGLLSKILARTKMDGA